MAVENARKTKQKSLLSVAVATGLLLGGGFHAATASELVTDLNSLTSFTQYQQVKTANAPQAAARMGIADNAVSGGADATEAYIIRRIQEQAEGEDNAELKALLASATTDAQAARLAGELTPDQSGANIYGVIQAQDLFTNTLRKRTSDYILGDFARTSVWATYLSSDYMMPVKSDGTNRYDGFDATSSGAAFGFEKILSADTVMGVAFSQQQVDAASRLYNNKTEIDSYLASLYATTVLSDWYFSGRGVVGWSANTAHRAIRESTGYTGKTDATARFNSQNIALQLDAMYPMYWQNFALLPTVSANYTWVKVEDYAENYIREFNNKGEPERSSGSPAALAYDEQSYQELNLGLGLEASYSFYFDYGVIQTRLGAGASFEMLDDELTSTAHLVSGSEKFTVGVAEREDTRYQAYASLLWETNGSFSWSFSAEREWDDKAENMMLYGRAVYSF
ncbi:autotransporter outer membrane beta-barrel domain-containing protein [uncultured Photobacterium sp.]|uniref:autotransporter outer membrane beta-barrel domain-containing protein n=1 Tax=uncultured Photobacterium sp. TaxID=173973 RepID=UPI002624B11B|nr:autotransporter outer membrane beta-barrel domain-containing protein [uncultured Photobacterium sp.]